MKSNQNRIRTVLPLVALCLSACSSMSNVWPFGDKPAPNQPRRLANSTEYQCEGGKHFYVRYADNGNTAWLIYPDHEVALTKGGAGTHYSNGVAALDINGAEATLNDGPTIAYKGCKVPAPAPAK